MSRNGPRGSMAMALVLVLMAVGATAGLIVFTRAVHPTPAPPPPPPPRPAVTAPAPVAETDVGPIAFRDPENHKHWESLRPHVEAVRTAIAAFDKATALPADDLEQRCDAIFVDANPLAGEAHKDVRSYADGAKRLCDLDRSVALIGLVARLQKSAPPKSKDEKRARCDFAAKWVKRLTDRGYTDDERAKGAIADAGRACI